jgi:hypothetical protein
MKVKRARRKIGAHAESVRLAGESIHGVIYETCEETISADVMIESCAAYSRRMGRVERDEVECCGVEELEPLLLSIH